MKWIFDNKKSIKDLPFETLLINVEKSIPIEYTTSVCLDFRASGFFRARKHNHIQGTFDVQENKIIPFEHEGEFWNMPEHLRHLIPFGRCNNEGESVFYCSTDMCTSILEAKPNKGEYVSVASFELKNPHEFSGSKVNFIGREYLSKISDIDKITKFSLEKREHITIEIDNYLDELFHKDIAENEEYLYKLSAAVTRCMMKDVLNEQNDPIVFSVDGLIYSSIIRDKKNYNLVYKPEHVRMNYFLKKVETFKVIANNNDIIILRKTRSGFTLESELTNRQINWLTDKNQKLLPILK